MTIYPVQANFSRGELSPRLHARVDIEYYRAALRTCTNWTVLRQGGLRKRPGFRMVKETKDNGKVRLIPFVFSTEQAYVLSVGNGYVRKYANGGLITTGGGTPTGITKANPAVVTLNSHGFNNGDRVYATAIGGMVQLQNREFTVANKTANTFELSGVNSSSYTTFTSGGSFKKIVETTTPYATADLAAIDYVQSADVLTLAHASHAPRELTRTSDTAWTISEIAFKDGPYLDEPETDHATVTPSATGAIHPKMTSNGAPSGSVSASSVSGTTVEYYAFDHDKETSWETNAVIYGWIEYDPPGSKVANAYWIRCDDKQVQRAPAAWEFQGYDGSAWVTLDAQQNQMSWGAGEVRYFEVMNFTAYNKYRIYVTGPADNTAGRISIGEIGIAESGDTMSAITFTFSAVTGINDGAGWQTNDVGRHFRIRGGDGIWRWVKITARTSTTVVDGKMYGHALPNLNPISRWQLGAWKDGQWPSKVGFFEARRVFARSDVESQVIWLSKTGDFYDYGTSQPLVDDDGMRLRIQSGRVNAITWLAEVERLAVGTIGTIRMLDKSNQNAGFGATNFDQKPQVFTGAKDNIKPVQVGSVLLYADYYGKSIRELVYDLNQDGYIAPDLSILSDHLLSRGIVEMAYQERPDSIVWILIDNGDLIALTYEREQKIVGLTRIDLAPGDADTNAIAESVCCIPGTMRDEVWISVRRQVGGNTVRHVETLTEEFDNMDTEDGVFLDCSLTYDSSATGTVYGLWHLAGLTVDALADGVVYNDLTVAANGSITLPNSVTASVIHVGLPYTATIRTLSLNEVGQRDGAAISRQKLLNDARISVMDSLGLKAKGVTSTDSFEVFIRDQDDPVNGQMNLRTGWYPLTFDMSHRDDGQFILYSEDPLPCLIRGIVFGATGEP